MERDDFDKLPEPALPLGVSACIGCGGRVYSLEHDGYCEACNRIAAPDGEKHWKWTLGVLLQNQSRRSLQAGLHAGNEQGMTA